MKRPPLCPSFCPSFAPLRRPAAGFTLLELMIVCVIVAVLAGIALPSYYYYVTRSKITDATTGLSDFNQRYQQYFLDARTYVGACAIYKPLINAYLQNFQVDCPTETTTTFVLTATGVAAQGMTNFVYQIDNAGLKTTQTLPDAAWGSGLTPINCWVIRKGGSCT